MSAEAWVFMVGFRIFDLGLLVLWLVWFFKLRGDEDDSPGEGGADDDDGGSPPPDRDGPSGGGGLGLLMPGRLDTGGRVRQHGGARRLRRPRGSGPLRHPAPARVRRPARRRRPVRA